MTVQSSFIPNLVNKKNKVFICVPTRDMMHSHFAYCLQALVKHNANIGIDTEVEFSLGTLIGTQREKLVAVALLSAATHILWLDSDMMFPADICEKLMFHDVPFVACDYSTRSMPLKGVAYEELHNWESNIPIDATGLVKVAGVGLGCALIKTNVFDHIYKPYFPITYTRKSDDYLGEDMNFCIKLSKEGNYPLLIDTDLSRHIYHIGMTAFSYNHQPVTVG